MVDTYKKFGKWRCNNCGTSKGVINGVCSNCGPIQTTPVDEVAKDLAGFAEAEAEKKEKLEAEKDK
jgi:predicted ATP-dependent serine protease